MKPDCIQDGLKIPADSREVRKIRNILIIEDDISLSNGIALALKDSEFSFVQVQNLCRQDKVLRQSILTSSFWTSICPTETGLIC